MKRFPEIARRAVSLALAASMSLSVLAPCASAAVTARDLENSVDELGNVDLTDEVFNVPDDTAAKPEIRETTEEPEFPAVEDDGVADDLTEEQLAEQAVVDEAGHTEHTPDTDAEPVYEQPATCAERGYAIYPCSFTLEQEDGTVAHCYHQVVVWLPLADHAWGEWQNDGNVTVGDQSVSYRKCTVCNAVELEDGTVVTSGSIAAVGPDQLPSVVDTSKIATYKHSHNWVHDSWKEGRGPTCTEGAHENMHCYEWWCPAVALDQWRAPLGHSWGAWTTVTEATCGADGLKKRVCGRDGSHVETEPIPATGNHDWGEWTTAEATCTAPGKKYRTCKICQKEEVDDTYAANHPATGHQTGGVKWTEGDNSEVGWVVDQPHKCVDGTKTRSCDDCDVTETVTVPASEEHQPSDWIVTLEPTCTTTGTHIKKCLECGAELESETMDALGHAWDEGTID